MPLTKASEYGRATSRPHEPPFRQHMPTVCSFPISSLAVRPERELGGVGPGGLGGRRVVALAR